MTPIWVPKIAHPARGAYEVAAMDQPCPNCDADPYEFCRAGHGHPRRVPCVARISAATKNSDPDIGSATDSAAAGNHSNS